MSNQIISEIILDLDRMREQLKEAEKAGEDGGKKTGDKFGGGIEKGISSGLSGIEKRLLGLGTALLGAFSLKHMIDEATGAQDALNSLAGAMRASGTGGMDAANAFAGWASSMQNLVGISDDVITANAGMLVSLGKLKGEGLQEASKAALDLAAGLNIDVQSAFMVVSKAASGHAELLNRYGANIRKTGDDAKDFAQALAFIKDRFDGLAESKANTFSGQLSRLTLAFNDLFEEMGKLIIKSPVVVALVKFVADAFSSAAEKVAAFGHSGDVVGELIKQLLEVSKIITVYIGAPLELLYNTGKVVFYELATLVSGFVTAAITSLRGLAELGALVSDRFVGMRDSLAQFQTAAEQSTADLEGKTKSSFENIFNFDATTAAEGFVTKLQTVAATAKPVAAQIGKDVKEAVQAPLFGITFDDIVTAMADTKNKVAITAAQIAQSLNQSIGNGAAGAFAAFGGALAKGENAFEAFGKSLLKSLGQLLVQFGTMMIMIGLNLSTVPFLFGLQGPAAIAAGTAAVILGGALQALGGSGGGAAAPSAAGGGVANDGSGGVAIPVASTSTQLADVEEKKPGTTIHLNIQGNVLDRRATGLEIVDILNENFGSNGLVLKGSV